MHDSFKSLDPDQLYYHYPEGSITFIYVPGSGNLHVAQYPTAHQDMLMDDDDVFDDVFGDIEYGPMMRTHMSSRGKALELTDSLLGRIAAVGDNYVVALWTTPSQEILQGFFEKLFAQFPALKKQEDAIVVVSPGMNPTTLSGREVDTVNPPPDTVRTTGQTKKYEIGGNRYSLQDLQKLRAAIHTKSDPAAMEILCHPDMDKYPELNGYRPATCTGGGAVRTSHPANWRKAGRAAQNPYVYSYGETFKQFIERN